MFEQAWQFILEQVGKNDLVAGGAVLGALAVILNYVKRVPLVILYWSRLAFLTEIDVPDRTNAFQWIDDWLAVHKYSKTAKRITVVSKDKPRLRQHRYGEWSEHKTGKAKVSPAPGTHVLWWRWRLLILTRIRRESTGDNAARQYRESWRIRFVGKRTQVDEFLEECRKVSEKDKDNNIVVMEGDRGYWQKSGARRKRPLSSVILPGKLSDTLVEDIKEFIDSQDWYYEMNIPWRRGYMFTGPPGNGKSSLVTAIASEIDYEVAICNLKTLDDDELVSLMSDLQEGTILLLEDIDCIFSERESKDDVKVSLSTVLNCLDGVNASEGRIVILTTNYPERLDPALIRPGRVDLTLNLPNATAKQASAMYERFFPSCKNSKEFGLKVAKLDVSMAKLQGYLLRHRKSMWDARANLDELKELEGA